MKKVMDVVDCLKMMRNAATIDNAIVEINRLRAEVERLRKTVWWYGDQWEHTGPAVNSGDQMRWDPTYELLEDGGYKARAALSKDTDQ